MSFHQKKQDALAHKSRYVNEAHRCCFKVPTWSSLALTGHLFLPRKKKPPPRRPRPCRRPLGAPGVSVINANTLESRKNCRRLREGAGAAAAAALRRLGVSHTC